MRLVDADTVVTIQVYDDMTEKTDTKKMTIAEAIDEWSDEGCPSIVDAEPVKHGHWTSSQGLAEVGEVQCSNCRTIYYAGDLYDVGETDENGIGQALMPNHCPHCGAKMEVAE